MDSSARKEKRRKEYSPEDPDSDPDSSDSLSRKSASSDNSNYKSKRGDKKKKYQKHKNQYPIKLCVKLTSKSLTTAYKSKVIKFKIYEYALQSRSYFLNFMESTEMIFLQYKETCEILLEYPKICKMRLKLGNKSYSI